MAVYKRTYRPYEGKLTPPWSRFLVITRQALAEMRRSRFLTILFFAAFFFPVLTAVALYAGHSVAVTKLLGKHLQASFVIDAQFFLHFLGLQSMVAFFLTAFAGPGLISTDLANNALPLYLARFSRAEYVLGKLSVLLIVLSLVTWMPGLLLFGFQTYFEDWTWFKNNLGIAGALFLGSWIWILLLSLLALALSAWVKWKPVAGALLFGVLFVAGGLANVVNELLDTRWGFLLNIRHLVNTVWVSLFFDPGKRQAAAAFFGSRNQPQLPLGWCWAGLAGICLFCIYLLSRRIRPVEVVR